MVGDGEDGEDGEAGARASEGIVQADQIVIGLKIREVG